MSPTIFKTNSFRFFFFSREEERMHVHVTCPNGEAKFWLEPIIGLANYHGLSKHQLREVQKIIEERADEIIKAWKSSIEINTTAFGIWIIIHRTEYFLPYENYPWFFNAKIADLYDVELTHGTHLHWPQLDIDLDLDSLNNPEKYPLVYRD